MELFNLLIPLVVVVLVILGVFAATGLVIISERQVGVVVKRFSGKSLPPDRLIALMVRLVIRRIHWHRVFIWATSRGSTTSAKYR